MRLTDLNPKWCLPTMQWASSSPYYTALTFDCPHCRTQRLAVYFKPAIDPEGLQKRYEWPEPNPGVLKWQRKGDTFETLTLEPSVNFDSTGHWHGSIVNGEMIPA